MSLPYPRGYNDTGCDGVPALLIPAASADARAEGATDNRVLYSYIPTHPVASVVGENRHCASAKQTLAGFHSEGIANALISVRERERYCSNTFVLIICCHIRIYQNLAQILVGLHRM